MIYEQGFHENQCPYILPYLNWAGHGLQKKAKKKKEGCQNNRNTSTVLAQVIFKFYL